MRRRASIVCLVLGLLAGGIATAHAQPARTIAPTIAPTIAHEILALESALLGPTAPQAALLDDIVREALARLADLRARQDRSQATERTRAIETLQAIDAVLVARNAVYPGDWPVDYLAEALTPTALDDRQMAEIRASPHNARRAAAIAANPSRRFLLLDAHTAAFVHLAVAEAAGLPLRLVEAPGHHFLRWPLADGGHVNFETMDGVEQDDAHFIETHGVPPETIRPGFFMTALTPVEVIAYAREMRGTGFDGKGEPEKARADFRFAIEARPASPFGMNALAWSYATCPTVACRNGPEAVRLAEAAVAVWPDANFLDTLACAYAANGDVAAALRTERAAIELDPKPAYEAKLALMKAGGICPGSGATLK